MHRYAAEIQTIAKLIDTGYGVICPCRILDVVPDISVQIQADKNPYDVSGPFSRLSGSLESTFRIKGEPARSSISAVLILGSATQKISTPLNDRLSGKAGKPSKSKSRCPFLSPFSNPPPGTFKVRPVRLAEPYYLDELDIQGVLNLRPLGLVGYGAQALTNEGYVTPGYRSRGFSKVSGITDNQLFLTPTNVFDAKAMPGDSGSPQFISGRVVSLTSSLEEIPATGHSGSPELPGTVY